MAKKLGMEKKVDRAAKAHEAVYEETVAHKHVPGRVFEINDPSAKLITMIGGGFFNEPKYYDTNRDPVDFYTELRTKGAISSVIVDKMGLSEQAKDVIETAQAVANSANPEDLLIIAAWARDTKSGLKLRYTPQIMLCIAAANEKTKPFVVKYATAIMQRADEIRQVFAAFRHLFHNKVGGMYKGNFPHCLRKALAAALAAQKPYGLVKYNNEERPTFGDVLLTLRGSYLSRFAKGKTGYPVSKGMFEYLVNGKIIDDAPKMIKERAKFFALKSLDEVTPQLVQDAGLTWENIISKFGSNAKTWELAIPMMGEMALTRNLRNFEEAKISDAAWRKVNEVCASVMDTKQLPFRFFAAKEQVNSTHAKSIADLQLDNACMNVPALSGVTAIFVDNSGSCTGCKVGGKSEMRVADAGNTLSAIIAKRFGINAMVGVFGDCFMWVPFSAADSCMAIKSLIDNTANKGDRAKLNALSVFDAAWLKTRGITKSRYSTSISGGYGVGAGTETGLWCGIDDLTQRKIKVDRIIICSDMCCYTSGDANNCGNDMNAYFGKGGDKATIQSMINKYRQQVNSNCFVHSIDLQGYGTAQVSPKDKRTQLLSGWSEQVFGLVRAFELGNSDEESNNNNVAEVKAATTIEILREMYKIS